MAKIILGYWDIRGIAEPIRYLLHYKKVDFEDKRYPADDPGFEQWQKEKLNLGLHFPGLPYYEEGGIQLTHSIAIMRYLGYRHGLNGNTHPEKCRVVLVEQQSADFRDKLISFVESHEFETTGKEGFLKSVQPMFQQWEKFLDGNRAFMAGDDVTYVDFIVFESLDQYRLFHESIMDDYPFLKAYLSRMKSLPELQVYIKSRKAWPIFSCKAKFGGSGDPPKHL